MSHKIFKTRKISMPSRMWIDGKCFTIKEEYKNTAIRKQPALQEVDDLQEHHNFNIVSNENGRLLTTFRLPSLYYYKINTHTEFTINALQMETSTTISMPKFSADGNITIEGDDISKVIEARHKLHYVVSQIRKRHGVLQFISIPLLSDQIKENFLKFKNAILNDPPVNGMHETIFQSPLKLHLTLAVFTLVDDKEIQAAIQALNDYKESVLNPLLARTGPLKIVVSGIDCMNNNHEKVDVLYANTKLTNETEEVTLQKIVNELSNYFYEKGLVVQHQESVRLHLTLINTKYRKDGNEPVRKRRWVKKQPFDARNIIAKYKDFHFGECDFDTVHLSLMKTKGEDGFYKPLHVIKML